MISPNTISALAVNNHLAEQLQQAASAGNIEVVKELLYTHGTNKNAIFTLKINKALQVAAKFGQLEVVEYILMVYAQTIANRAKLELNMALTALADSTIASNKRAPVALCIIKNYHQDELVRKSPGFAEALGLIAETGEFALVKAIMETYGRGLASERQALGLGMALKRAIRAHKSDIVQYILQHYRNDPIIQEILSFDSALKQSQQFTVIDQSLQNNLAKLKQELEKAIVSGRAWVVRYLFDAYGDNPIAQATFDPNWILVKAIENKQFDIIAWLVTNYPDNPSAKIILRLDLALKAAVNHHQLLEQTNTVIRLLDVCSHNDKIMRGLNLDKVLEAAIIKDNHELSQHIMQHYANYLAQALSKTNIIRLFELAIKHNSLNVIQAILATYEHKIDIDTRLKLAADLRQAVIFGLQHHHRSAVEQILIAYTNKASTALINEVMQLFDIELSDADSLYLNTIFDKILNKIAITQTTKTRQSELCACTNNLIAVEQIHQQKLAKLEQLRNKAMGLMMQSHADLLLHVKTPQQLGALLSKLRTTPTTDTAQVQRKVIVMLDDPTAFDYIGNASLIIHILGGSFTIQYNNTSPQYPQMPVLIRHVIEQTLGSGVKIMENTSIDPAKLGNFPK